MHSTEYQKLIHKAIGSDAVERKAALKVLDLQSYRTTNEESSVILELLPLPGDIIADSGRFEAALRLLSAAAFSHAASAYQSQLHDVAWRGLEHEKGAVRQASLSLFRQLRGVHDTRDRVAHVDYYVKLLDQIENKLEQYRPARIPLSVEKAPPSIYKTLTMLWHDIVEIPILEDRILVSRRLFEKNIMPYYEPISEDNPDVEHFGLSDWKGQLERYATYDDPAAIKRQLKKLEARTLRFLGWALNDLDLAHLKPDVVAYARVGDSSKLIEIVRGILLPAIQKAENEEDSLYMALQLNKLARSVQALDNTVVHVSDAGLPFNRTVVDAICCEQLNMRPKKVLVDTIVEAVTDAHTAVDSLQIILEKEIKADAARWRKVYQALREHGEAYVEHKIDLREPIQIIHYMIDKLPYVDYRYVIRTPPEKIVAGLTYLFEGQNPWLGLPGADTDKLSVFGQWKSSSSVSRVASECHYRISQNLHDPLMLLSVQSREDMDFVRDELAIINTK